MNINGIDVDYEPGESYETTHMQADEDARSNRAAMRQEAISEFTTKAQLTTEQQINHAVGVVLGLVIQYRALGGTGEQALADKLREAADFLEDL